MLDEAVLEIRVKFATVEIREESSPWELERVAHQCCYGKRARDLFTNYSSESILCCHDWDKPLQVDSTSL